MSAPSLLEADLMAASKSASDRVGPAREHTFTWGDPVAAAAAGRGLTGREILEAIVARRISAPPAASLVGFWIDVVDEGRVEMILEPAEYMYNTIGSLHGGIVATLLDSVMGCAVWTLLDAHTAHATLEIHANFVRPATVATGPLRAIGRVLHLGSRTATAESRMVDTNARLYAHGSTTCLLTPRDV